MFIFHVDDYVCYSDICSVVFIYTEAKALIWPEDGSCDDVPISEITIILLISFFIIIIFRLENSVFKV